MQNSTKQLLPVTKPFVPDRDDSHDPKDFLGSLGMGMYGAFFQAVRFSIPWVEMFLQVPRESDWKHIAVMQRTQQWWYDHKVSETMELLHDALGIFDALRAADTPDRLEEPSFQELTRTAFQIWNKAASREKREYIVRLLTNVGGNKYPSDHTARAFLDRIDRYHALHFKILRDLWEHPDTASSAIQERVYPSEVLLPIAEREVFQLTLHELVSTGTVCRGNGVPFSSQRTDSDHTEMNYPGMTGAAADARMYGLTGFGQSFVANIMLNRVPSTEDNPDRVRCVNRIPAEPGGSI